MLLGFMFGNCVMAPLIGRNAMFGGPPRARHYRYLAG
jgi:hypothetical protein